MGIRFILLIIAIIAVWLIIRSLIQKNSISLNSKDTPAKAKLEPEKIIACHHCGLHIPLNDAIKSGDKLYCCEEHAKQD